MKRLKRHLVIAMAIAVVIVGIRFTQELIDGVRLIGYEPPPEIAAMAAKTMMTDVAKRIFYVNQPTIENRKLSLNLCKSSEHTIVLGCYVTTKGIFLQSVTDPRLDGVMEVTAAHEMLHAAYQRMSLWQQSQLNQKLRSALAQLQNPRILKLIDAYNQQDPSSVDSELHSMLGTEVRALTSELEAHYRQYFTDRSQVVALSERYEGVFTAIRNKTKTLNQQLTSLRSELNRLGTQVKQQAQAVESERSDLKAAILANPNSDYRPRVATFNQQVQSYNLLVSQLKAQTDTYNQMVTEHNSLALEEKSLVESLENESTVDSSTQSVAN
jgi:uncharacterized protein YukE